MIPRLVPVVGFFSPRSRQPNKRYEHENPNKKEVSRAKRPKSASRCWAATSWSAPWNGRGSNVIFAYPGGASMEIHQSLTRSTIRTILPRHEQGGSFAAEGYARATGRPGVCMATSGPGATNLVTAIADAYMDSVPLVAITGQVPQSMIGKGAFQETDFFGMTLPIVKHSYLITDVNDIPRIVKEAFYIARDRAARSGGDRFSEEPPAGQDAAHLAERSPLARI